MLHDSASRNEVARGPGSVDGTPSDIKASALLDTVVENYGSCNENIEKLKARYGEKFSSDRAINRDLEKERMILEK